MSDSPHEYEGNPDEPPRTAWWVPDDAVKNLTMEKALHSNESHAQLARRLIDEALPLATMAITHMAIHSRKEEIRLNAAKYIMEHAIGAPGKSSDVPMVGGNAWDTVYSAVLMPSEGKK